MKAPATKIVMFDVEATSLHGKGFAVGAVVYDENDIIIDQFSLKSTYLEAIANEWVKENVVPKLKDMPSVHSGYQLRTRFYEFLQKHTSDTTEFWGDCIFPVETNFLADIVKDDPSREFKMPYPLYDVANFLGVNINRAEYSELQICTEHHPVYDATASFLCLRKKLKMLHHE